MKQTATSRSRGRTVPVSGGTVRIAIDAEPRALLPYSTTSAASTDVQGFLYLQLADVAPDLETYVPRLARDWEWNPDHSVLEVQLRDGLRWDDGAPLGAEDVRFSFEAARHPGLAWNGAAWKTRIRDCEVAGPLTVRFHFTEVYPDQFMDANAGFIVPKHRLQDVSIERWVAAARAPVGCGPFRLESWIPGESLTLARNPFFHERGLPYLDRVTLVVLPDPAAREQALRDGEVDLVPQLTEHEAARLRAAAEAGASDVCITSVRGRQYDFVCYNPRHPALGSRAVRRALTLAVDRRSIIQTLCSGFAEPFESPIVPIVWAYDAGIPLTPYDPAAARALLEAEGWREEGDGLRRKSGVPLAFELATNCESARRAGVARVLAEYWRVVGAQVSVSLCERHAMLDRLDGRRFDAALSGWRARLKADLEPMWGCSSVGSKTNRVDYCNPDVDRLNAAALRTPDREEARRLFHAAQRLVAQDHPYTWLYYLHDVIGTHPRLRGAVFDARGVLLNPQEWWVSSPDT